MPKSAVLNPLNAREIDEILAMLDAQDLLVRPEFLVSESIDSTNAAALRAAESSASGSVWLAEQQTAGRGRRGKYWHSPQSTSIYFSMLWHFDEVQGLDGLSLAVGVVVAELLDSMGLSNVALKWPNDVLCEQRKLGGILLEMQMRKDGRPSVVMGIGLNVAVPQLESKEIDQPWTDVYSQLEDCPSRNQIIAELALGLCKMLQLFERDGFAAFKARWDQFDYLSGQSVDLYMKDGTIPGNALGVADDGALLVFFDEQTHFIYGGEVSVRARSIE
ncbi:MAG: biotin--[acetyl-CoA-carboxylase] ligase [Pseudomonadota bacterium]